MFHSLGAEQENDPSYIVVLDFGTYNDPVSVDRKFRVYTCDTGFSEVDMYPGVRSFNTLYVNTALLKFILFGTKNQPSSLIENIHFVRITPIYSIFKITQQIMFDIAYVFTCVVDSCIVCV